MELTKNRDIAAWISNSDYQLIGSLTKTEQIRSEIDDQAHIRRLIQTFLVGKPESYLLELKNYAFQRTIVTK
jgi:hypothetical protein